MKTDQDYNKRLLQAIGNFNKTATLMEVCGTHTMAIARSGIRDLLPPYIRLISGPGCPVCVTSQGDIDRVIQLARNHDITLLTFGDMMRVPGSESSLQQCRSQGADIRVVYSPLDALQLACQNPQREMVFLGIGFETTAPAIAHTIIEAQRLGVRNFSVWSLHKTVPPALEAIFSDPELELDGLICPGHVSLVIGCAAYEELISKHHKPCVVTGFDERDILEGIYMLMRQIASGQARVEIQYKRLVKPEGNLIAQGLIAQVFEPVTVNWRGLGVLPGSGLAIRESYADFDASRRFNVPDIEEKPIRGCACGAILTGKISPSQCALFGTVCSPLNPVGPCMVSQEGACAAHYRYNIPMKGRELK